MAKKKESEEVAEETKPETKAVVKPAAKKVIAKKTFNLEKFKESQGYDKVMYKPLEWFMASPAFGDATGVPGAPAGFITIVRGHTDTGKTTFLLEIARDAQSKGVLPVFIITEMKWNWEHAKLMGFEFEEVKNAKGEVTNYSGFFIYVDKTEVKTIEGVAKFINKLLKNQLAGELPYDLLFIWDSIGSVPCDLSVEKGNNNNEWNAGAMSREFGSSINQSIVASRKMEFPYTNTMVCANKVWVQKPPQGNPKAQPKMQNKGGTTMQFDAGMMITFGGVSSSGIYKIKAQRTIAKNAKQISYASSVQVAIAKNHVTGIDTTARVTVTPHGYIPDTKEAQKKYKEEHLDYLCSLLGGGVSDGSDIEISVDDTEADVPYDITDQTEGEIPELD